MRILSERPVLAVAVALVMVLSGTALLGGISVGGSAREPPRPAFSAGVPRGASIAASPAPLWGSSNFSHDVQVTFALPGGSPSFGTQFTTEPVINDVPEYANGFWMNISTDKPLIYANVTIWGTEWPVQNRQTPIPSYSPQNPRTEQMLVNSSSPNQASFFFNDYRFFWPGDTVLFNLTLTGLGATPAVIYSTNPYSYPDGPGLTASWLFFVQGPWSSENFSNSIQLSTNPPALASPSFAPNPDQGLQITLNALAPPGLLVGTIPAAQLTYSVNQSGSSTTRTAAFAPANHTTVQLLQPIGPYPNSTVSFNVTAWLPWEGGAIDRLYSPQYTFNWSIHGGWKFPNQGLLSNLILATNPNILPPANGIVGVGTAVNVTIHEPQPNITIGSAQVNFVFANGEATHSGVLPMTPTSPNSSFANIPGLPPESSVTFFVSAKDIFGTPVFSRNYTYSTGRFPSTPYPTDREVFYVEALDIAGTGLVAGLNFTLSNASWSETGDGTPLGFVVPVIPHGSDLQTLALGYGAYQLGITAFGRSYTTTVILTNSTPFTVLFYVASGPVSETTVSSIPTVPVGSVLGLGAAVIALAFVWPWFRERRKKAEEEQRRITL